jgi:ABC-2 type transport system ATP-binding protein
LNDSLTEDAFKTSTRHCYSLPWCSRARINPQIYGGIITGAVLGILTPGQQALLAASGRTS